MPPTPAAHAPPLLRLDDLLLRMTPPALRHVDLCTGIWRLALERPVGSPCSSCGEHVVRFAFEPSTFAVAGTPHRTNVVLRRGGCRCLAAVRLVPPEERA